MLVGGMSVFSNFLFILVVIFTQSCLKRDGVGTSASPCAMSLSLIQKPNDSDFLALNHVSGGVNYTSALAQSFVLQAQTEFSSNIQLWLKKVGRPGSYAFISIQKNSGGTPLGLQAPFGVQPNFTIKEQQKLAGIPDGIPLYGARIELSDLQEGRADLVTVTLDHGTLAKNVANTRRIAQANLPKISLEAGTYWVVLESLAPVNSSDYVAWGSHSKNLYTPGHSLSASAGEKRVWSISQTGMDRDMSFSIGCSIE